GRFYRSLMGRLFHYAASRVPEISDDLASIDRAMRWGFSWEFGIFELWDVIGHENVMALWREENQAAPPLLEKLLSSGGTRFYRNATGRNTVFNFSRGGYTAIQEQPGVLSLSRAKASRGEVKKNAGASLIDLGDGVLCLEFHSKMNTIGPDILEMIHAGVNLLGPQFEAMVIGNQAANFSAGANLMLLLLAIQAGEWDEVEESVRAFQNANMALKYAVRPVVAAPFGLTLGGGVEISLHCARRLAAAETYMGLVETSVGLIPAGGGTKEMLLRIADPTCGAADGDPWVPLKEVFANLGMAKVSSSATEARKLRYLDPQDVICMSRERQLEAAKQLALSLVTLNHSPAQRREDVCVQGQGAFSSMKLGLHLMRRAERISDH
ncbi:MAG: enoyl-CoA hydratase/isomerase family protein, partial [Terriglobia bacterium]